jgi:PPIC-type PPIASE domain
MIRFVSRRMSKTVVAVSIVAAICASLGLACKNQPKSPVVARVGSSVLTLDELYKTIPPEYSDFITREQIFNYVKRWIDNKILFHEALRLKIDKEETMQDRMRRMKEDLLCAEMISRNAAPLQEIRVPDDQVAQYFEENKGKFVRDKNVAKCIQIVCNDAATAWKVRSLVTQENFMALASQYSKVPPADVKSAPYLKLDDLPAELSQEIATTKINGTTNVIKTGSTYCVVRVLDKQPKGTMCQLDEVREDIVNILAAKMQNAALERLISTLRSKMIVEAHLDVIAGHQGNGPDTAAPPPKQDARSSDSLRMQSQE